MNIVKRFIGVVAVLVLVSFVTIGCATGGYGGYGRYGYGGYLADPYSYPLGSVMQGNLAMVNPIGYRNIGGYRGMGMGYGLMGSSMGMGMGYGNLPMSCGMGGAGGAMLAGAAGCSIVELALSRRNYQGGQFIIPQRNQQAAIRYAPDGMPIAVGRPVVQAPPSSGGSYQSETIVRQQSPVPQNAFSDDPEKVALARQLYGKCWTRSNLLEKLGRYDLTMRDVKDISRGSTYINMWETTLILTAKDGSLDQCEVPAGGERVFILPAGNAGVNALVRLEQNGHMLPITGNQMDWEPLGGSEGWIISPKCDSQPCRAE